MALSLNDKRVMTCLGQYVSWALNDTFSQRYQTSDNPHLKLFEKLEAGLLDSWRQNETVALRELVSDKEKVTHKRQTIFEWMHMVLLNDEHLNMDELELNGLKRYLSKDSTAELRTGGWWRKSLRRLATVSLTKSMGITVLRPEFASKIKRGRPVCVLIAKS